MRWWYLMFIASSWYTYPNTPPPHPHNLSLSTYTSIVYHLLNPSQLNTLNRVTINCTQLTSHSVSRANSVSAPLPPPPAPREVLRGYSAPTSDISWRHKWHYIRTCDTISRHTHIQCPSVNINASILTSRSESW